MKKNFEDTIVAIATPLGEGALSVIRVSGELAVRLVASRFKGKKELISAKSHSAHYGRIIDTTGKIVDEAVCTVFRAPNSFTGEDTVEVSCHGGIHVTRRVLECLIESGARPAEPGEFTQRAFINGKIDLSQAEAIADLVRAQTDKAYQSSIRQLEGVLSKKLLKVREQLVRSLGLLELELDFVEEDIELIDIRKVQEDISRGLVEIDSLLDTYKYGKVWREGVRVALVGAPNAGKSSLLNAMLQEERAIVTHIPGTTRDFIEERLVIHGVLFRMIDTAGLRETNDPIEVEGVKRTWKVSEESDIIVLVHDCMKPLTTDEVEFTAKIRKLNRSLKTLIIANNKIDLINDSATLDIRIEGHTLIGTSALKNEGIEELKQLLSKQVFDKSVVDSRESVTITNERHYAALLNAKGSLLASLESIKAKKSEEFIAIDLRSAIESIGEIVGLVTTEDILNDIFSKFCIGK